MKQLTLFTDKEFPISPVVPGEAIFGSQEFCGKWFEMKEAIKLIDPGVGRNTILIFLKIYGIVDKKCRAVIDEKRFPFFKIITIVDSKSSKLHYFDNKVTCISGHGILVLRRVLEVNRSQGANI